MKRTKRYSRNEFRYNKNTKHTNYVFEEENNKYHSLGLTHQSYTWDKKKKTLRKNTPLLHNPQQWQPSKSHIRYGIITDNKNSFGKRRNNFSFHPDDVPKVKFIIRNYKNRRRKK